MAKIKIDRKVRWRWREGLRGSENKIEHFNRLYLRKYSRCHIICLAVLPELFPATDSCLGSYLLVRIQSLGSPDVNIFVSVRLTTTEYMILSII